MFGQMPKINTRFFKCSKTAKRGKNAQDFYKILTSVPKLLVVGKNAQDKYKTFQVFLD